MTVRNAARRMHVSAEWAMHIARKYNLLIPMGKGQRRRHLRVVPEQLRLAILSDREREGRRRPVVYSRRGEPLNPAVRC
jgi:hypothetical protein